MLLSGQRALITGAASGLGKAIAAAFAAEGARVAIFDVDGKQAAAVAGKLRGQGYQAIALQGSVTDANEVEAAFCSTDQQFGGLDILVNNAGVSGNVPSVELSEAFWHKVIGINLTGVFLCSQAAGRRMLAQRSGVIVNIASIFGELAAPERLAYCASKAGVCLMTKVLAVEWGPLGVRVNAVSPGYVHTPLIDDLIAKGRLDIEPIRRRPSLGRLGEPQEIAALCVFLASRKASYITGQVYPVDGGWSAYGYV